MEDHKKTKTQLISELVEARRHIAELEKAEAERRRTEKDLIESEERYRIVIENSNDGVALIMGDQHIYMNRKFLEMFGYETSDDFIGNPIYGNVHPNDREMVVEYNRKRQKGETISSRYEFKGVKKDGTVIFVEVSAAAITYHGESCTLAYFRDITERRQAIESLEGTRLLLEAVIEQSPVPIAVVSSPDLVVRYRNRAVTEILGVLDEPTYMGLNQYDVFKRRTWQEFTTDGKPIEISQLPLARALRGEVTKNEENCILRKDGTQRWVLSSATPVYNNTGELIAGVLVFPDITERKRANEELQASRVFLETIIEHSPLSMWVLDNKGTLIHMNQASRELFHVTDEEVIMKYNVFEDNILEKKGMISLAKAVFEQGERAHFTIDYDTTQLQSIHFKEATQIVLEITVSPILNSEKNVALVVVQCLDITNRVHAEKEKEILQAQLNQSQKMEAIGILAGGIAHDFNNILTALMGYGTLLRTKISEKDPSNVYIDQILSASQKAASLIHGLLAFSRQQPITLNPTRMNNIVKNTQSLLSRVISEDIMLKTVLSHNDIAIMADETQIDQILFNLVTNSRDAMPSGGTITIETDLVEVDYQFRHFHGYGEAGTYGRLSISDTGMGMEEATMKRIFDPFFTTKEVGKGTGLGLSTVYGIVKQHNGFITVYSEPGMGTTFHIYLPAAQKIIEDRKSESAFSKGGRETVLVAEDNEAVRELMRDVLIEYGYTVIEAIDGIDAIGKFKKTDKVDLLILDSIMPGKNGREVYDEISQIRPDIKVLFTSGYTRDTILDKGIEDKKFAFLSKPMSPDGLLEKVREVLDK
jgi:two-component system, cell cycle sensor histidine kinase and response regulator CckA